MFILIGKLLKPLATPLGMSHVLWILGALVYWRWSRPWGRRAIAGGILILLFFSNLEVGEGLLGSLENDYEMRTPEESPAADAIVVLGGSTFPPIPPRVTVEVGSSFDRLLFAMRLLRLQRAPLMVLSGGATLFIGSDMTEASRLQELALESGADPEAILLEERSRNTYENALYSKELLAAMKINRILLVTSARHMPRAVRVFRKQGFDVVPAPTDVLVVDKGFHIARLVPDLDGLEASTMALKEYSSLLVYWLRGWIG